MAALRQPNFVVAVQAAAGPCITGDGMFACMLLSMHYVETIRAHCRRI